MSSKTQIATTLFLSGFNCAQSVLSVFCEKYGMDTDTALKMTSGFGAGVRSGEICGAVSGAALVIGLKYGRTSIADEAAKNNCHQKTVEFMDLFREKNSSVVCREILKLNLSIEEEYAQAQDQNLFNTVCVDMVESAVAILEQLDY